ncbi:MAG: hypothetical protein MI923_04810 [Phycisphaerales bacterium]|nr:hypothetical protein [Phycisphaerales bacterium]
MTTDEVKKAVKRHRHAAVIGGVVGLIVLAGWIGYVVAMTPQKPVISSAPAEEVVAFIANKRGLAKLPHIEQQQFLERWHEHIIQPENRDELKQCLEHLDDDDRKKFTESVFEHLKRAFVDDAKHFSRLTDRSEKSRFLRRKVTELHERAVFIKDVAKGSMGNFGGQEELQAWLIEHTSPKERQLGEPYLEALKRVGAQMQKETRKGS